MLTWKKWRLQADERRAQREQRARMLLLEAMAYEPELWWGTIELLEVTHLNSGHAALALIQLRMRELIIAEQRFRSDFSLPQTLFQITETGIRELNIARNA